MLSLIDPRKPQEALGYNVSVSKLNALNGGRGFAVGYKSKFLLKNMSFSSDPGTSWESRQ